MFFLAFLLPLLAFASPVLEGRHGLGVSPALPSRVVHQFPNHTWLENIVPRSNGDLLVTALLPYAAIYQISDPTSDYASVSLIANFTTVNSLLGITETKPDVFVVVGGNFTSPGVQVNGTFSAWEVDLSQSSSHHHHHHNSKYDVSPRLITAFKPAAFLNGLESLPQNPTTVLISDSTLGIVWRLDTVTGKFNKALGFPEMKVAPGSPFAIGVNGLRIANDTLYFTNSFERTIYSVRIDGNGSVALGAGIEKVVEIEEAAFLDDIAIGEDGTIWACENVGNRLWSVTPNGTYAAVLGGVNETTVAGDTAAAFGRGKEEGKVLYVVTSGVQAAPVNGTFVEGGKVVAVDTSGF
ncbi:hypothetical protein GE09DRAFT_1260110 [Coniochaeta sp. 2T2.1]|nr:hypothetical protein GE09DRAFT_1260110 [Coniochaeta sp. 2T2.1]